MEATIWTKRLRAALAGPLLALGCLGADDLPSAITDAPSDLPPIAEPPSADDGLGAMLVPGQTVLPIDLGNVLRLTGARDLDVRIARERVMLAVAELEQARVLWLPSLFLGPNWIRHDGQAQIVEGPVRTISKSSLFLGATAAAGQGVSGPVPAGGPAQVGGLTTVLRISDAVFEPMAAQDRAEARTAAVQAALNDAILGSAESYFDLQRAAGRLGIAREAVAHAEALTRITASYARSGAGLEADHRRGLAELEGRRRQVEAAVGELEVASADVVRRTRIDPRALLAPVEPPETLLRMAGDTCPLDELIAIGLRNRPELSEGRALVEASIVKLRQAKLRPFVPSLSVRFSGGGFGGGTNGFFGDFNSRQDTDVNLFWELQNLGLADRAIVRQRAAQQRAADLELLKVQDRVAMQVVQADKARLAAVRQYNEAGRALPEAVSSLRLNLANMTKGAGLPGATRPIEVLQPIQALANAREDFLDSVLAYNRAQFRLYHALGRPPLVLQEGSPNPMAAAAVSPGPG